MRHNIKIILSVLILILFQSPLKAQTLAQAQKLYENGEYQEALPVFQKYVKQAPSNGNYNLWYGDCLLKTGSAQEALPYLQTALKKKAKSSQWRLAQCYDALYMYEDAVNNYEIYLSDLVKLKRTNEEAERDLEQARIRLRLLRGVEKVLILDSILIPKADFLEAYDLSRESGSLTPFNVFFSSSDPLQTGTVYQSQIGNQIFYGQYDPTNSLSRIYMAEKLGQGWSKGQMLSEEVNAPDADAAYPFMMPDGTTFYFASKSDRSMGGYDIFVTRYDGRDGTFLDPENVGMPFNSVYNDYMYAVDEMNNLGWFASDRCQRQDTVCVYVFQPSESKQVYSFENTDKNELALLAQATDIHKTWSGREQEAKEGLQRLEKARQSMPSLASGSKQGLFIVDDSRSIFSTSDFRSATARQLYGTYQEKVKEHERVTSQLSGMRDQAAIGSLDESLRQEILALERREMSLYNEIRDLGKKIRQEEKANL